MDSYKLISADSHVNEPPHVWQKRVPAQFKERAPRMQRFEQGDGWVLEGVPFPYPFGMTNCAGETREQRERHSWWVKWEDTPKGSDDPRARLSELDADRVDAELLYPTPSLSGAIYRNKDADFHLACVRAYNDWLSEYCAVAPDRLVGLAMLPNVGVEAAVLELRRAMELPGIGGAMIGRYPHGDLQIKPEDDALWATAEAMGVGLSIHTGLTGDGPLYSPVDRPAGFLAEERFRDIPIRAAQFIYTKVFERYPRLNIIFAEADAGYAPAFAEQMDNMYKRGNVRPPLKLKELPSYYFRHNLAFSFITDTYGIANRHWVGVDRMLWSSDYPHARANWPHSWKVIETEFAGVPPVEKQAMLAGNAVRLYGLVAKGRP